MFTFIEKILKKDLLHFFLKKFSLFFNDIHR